MSQVDQTVKLRAQEIAANSTEPITTVKALERAALDRYPTREAMATAFAALGASALSGLRKRSYDLPEHDGLFDLPSYIVIATTDGDLIVPKSQASLGQARQWQREALQHHATQQTRFKRAGKDIALLDDVDDDVLWDEARMMLDDRRQKLLEAGS